MQLSRRLHCVKASCPVSLYHSVRVPHHLIVTTTTTTVIIIIIAITTTMIDTSFSPQLDRDTALCFCYITTSQLWGWLIQPFHHWYGQAVYEGGGVTFPPQGNLSKDTGSYLLIQLMQQAQRTGPMDVGFQHRALESLIHGRKLCTLCCGFVSSACAPKQGTLSHLLYQRTEM